MASVTIRRSDAHDLPPICCCCGEPATRSRTEKCAWNPSWVLLLFFVGFLPWVICLWLTRRSAVLEMPVCERHARRSVRVWVAVGVCVAAGAALLCAYSFLGDRKDFSTYLIAGAVGSFVLAVFAAFVLSDDKVRTAYIDDRGVTLDGVNAGFAKALGVGERRPAPVRTGGMELTTARYYRG